MHPTFRGSAEGETHSKSDAVAKGTHAVRVTRSESDAVTVRVARTENNAVRCVRKAVQATQ